MGKVILIAGIVFIALAVIEIEWFILRGITSGINQCHEWEENPDKKESVETREPENLSPGRRERAARGAFPPGGLPD